jgi:hypothetical protein
MLHSGTGWCNHQCLAIMGSKCGGGKDLVGWEMDTLGLIGRDAVMDAGMDQDRTLHAMACVEDALGLSQ